MEICFGKCAFALLILNECLNRTTVSIANQVDRAPSTMAVLVNIEYCYIKYVVYVIVLLIVYSNFKKRNGIFKNYLGF